MTDGGTFQGGGFVTPAGGVPRHRDAPTTTIPPVAWPEVPDPFYAQALLAACTLFAFRHEDLPPRGEADDDAALWFEVQRYADWMAEYLRQRTAHAAAEAQRLSGR